MADTLGSTPIISADARRRIRRPGSRRRVVVVAVFLGVVALAVTTYVIVGRHVGRLDPLSAYTVATVRSGPLIELVSVSGSVRMARYGVASASRSGTVAETFCTPGQYVEAGTALARIESDALERELLEVRGAINRNDSEREALAAELELVSRIAEHRMDRLAAVCDRLASELLVTRELHAIGSVTSSDLDSAEDALEAARADLEMYQLESRLDELRYAQNAEALIRESETLQVRLDSMDDEIDSLLIRASLAGVVQDLVEPGQYIEQRQVVARVVDPDSVTVDASVPNRLRASFGVTVPVVVRIAGQEYTGTVIATDTRAVRTGESNETSVGIEVSIQEAPSDLLEGTPASVAVEAVRKQSALVVPRGPFYGSSGERYLFLVDGTRAVRTEARFGLVTAAEIEILSGVEEGDRIITSSYSGFIDAESIELVPTEENTQ